MGAVCARCSDVKRADASNTQAGPPAELDCSDNDGEEDEDDEEVAASSEEEDDGEEFKKGVEGILETTGKTLKRGKTMAMKEAISTAKKAGIAGNKITEAETQLDNHKKAQRREEVEKEVETFFASQASKDIPVCEKMLKKAAEASCKEAMHRLQKHLEELVQMRKLEDGEVSSSREYLKQSCRDFVLAATKGDGRPVIFQDAEGQGRKLPATLSLDPPLMNLILVKEQQEDGRMEPSAPLLVPVQSLKATSVSADRDFKAKNIEEDDLDCLVLIRYVAEGKPGLWCFVEPTPLRRDRLIEAILVLTTASRCRVGG